MSIINDALRKAKKAQEENRSHLLSPADISKQPIELHFEKKKSGVNWGPVFILLVLALITGPIVAPLFYSPMKNEQMSQVASKPRTPSYEVPAGSEVQLASLPRELQTQKAQFGIEEMPLPAALPPMHFDLSGIVFGTKSDAYCILNKRVARVGEMVDGAKIVSVSPDKVVLIYQGEKIELYAST